ncbi:MAG: AAA-like domain-containing protein [Rivularia sp. (in: cyanobacteria)]
MLNSLLEQASRERGIFRHHLPEKLDDLLSNPDLATVFTQILTAQTVVIPPTVAYKLESIGLIKLTPDGAILNRELYRPYFSPNLGKLLRT